MIASTLANMMDSAFVHAMQSPVSHLFLASGGGAPDGAAANDESGATLEAINWAEQLLFYIVNVGVVTIAFGMVLMLHRILKGPQLADRVLAADAISMHVVGLVILLAIRLRTDVFFDAALILAIIGFASTLAFAQYIGNRRSIGAP
jgi:multicomponent K+:H+ antiporter subunit F